MHIFIGRNPQFWPKSDFSSFQLAEFSQSGNSMGFPTEKGVLTVFCFLPHNAFQVDTGARLAGAQTLRLCGKSHVGCVDGDRARADHDLFTWRGDVCAANRSEEMKRWRGRR